MSFSQKMQLKKSKKYYIYHQKIIKNTHIFNMSPVCSVAPHSGPTHKIIKKWRKILKKLQRSMLIFLLLGSSHKVFWRMLVSCQKPKRFLFSDEKLFGAGVDNSVGGVVSGHHEVVGSAAPVSVTNWQTLMTTYFEARLNTHKEFLQSPQSTLLVRHC